MWVFTKAGFLSAVQHDDGPETMRIRARRQKDLVAAFPEHADKVIDHAATDGEFDYRWHLDVDRDEWVGFLVDMGSEVDYTSHAKEAMSHGDQPFYSALLRVWTEMHKLQGGGAPGTLFNELHDEDVDEFGWEDDDEMTDATSSDYERWQAANDRLMRRI